MRRRSTKALFAVITSLILAMFNLQPGQPPVSVAGAVAIAAGYADYSYSSSVHMPTGEKPQSKLWYNDGRWWGSLFHNASNSYHIFWLDLTTQTWKDSGVALDTRPQTQADCLWDGMHLYVASGGGSISSGANLAGVLYRYSYNPAAKTYTRDFGPITIRPGGAETMVLDKDSTGKLWISYTQNNTVYVNRSTTADNLWGSPFTVPAANVNINVDADDISSLIAFAGKIGVVWSNQVDKTFYYAVHTDGAADTSWTGGIAARQPNTPLADDHINLKSLRSDPSGQLFAVVKTSINGTTDAEPQLLLLVRKADGSWSRATVSSGAENQTRPILLIDTDHRQLYVFMSNESGGSVYYKQSNMDNIQFPTGYGTPFIKGGGLVLLNNATSTKQSVNSATGIAVLASDDSVKWYAHNYLDLGGPSPRLVFSAQPYRSQVGAPFTTQPIVLVQDTPGHTDTTYDGPVTLAIKSGTGAAGAALRGTIAIEAVNGVARFSGLSINKAGAGYRLTAGAPSFNSGSSDSFDVVKGDQTIQFGALASKIYGDPPFTLAATATSGLPVSFSASGSCTLTGARLTIGGVGGCSVTANQSGDTNYNPAPSVTRSFTINKANQTISFAPLPDKRYTDPPFSVSATASSGLAVSLSAAGVCTLSSGMVYLSGVGTCTITARQAGSANFNPATSVVHSFRVVNQYQVFLPLVLP